MHLHVHARYLLATAGYWVIEIFLKSPAPLHYSSRSQQPRDLTCRVAILSRMFNLFNLTCRFFFVILCATNIIGTTIFTFFRLLPPLLVLFIFVFSLFTDGSFLHDTNLCGTIGKNYPYSNGRVDPIGSCSPGTIHSYKKSGPSNEDQLYTDTSFIYNPLCSDESSLLNSLCSTPSSIQTSYQAPEIKVKSEINLLDTQKVNFSEVTPMPPPRTGKPNLEKLNQILSRRTEAALKPKQPSTNSQDNASSQSSMVEVETTAIVHQPAEDTPKPDPLEDEEFQNPVDQKKLKTKPPRKNKNSKMSLCDEKSKSESKNENEIITKPEPQDHQEFITEPVCIPEVKIDTEAGNIEPELIELLEHSKPESVNETVSKNIPNIIIKPENVTRPEIIIVPESNNFESFTENFMKPEVILEADLLSFHRTSSPMHDDDDKFSYISSVSLEYDGDNFIMKSSLSEDETVSRNSSNSRASKESDEINPLDSVIPDCDDICWREKNSYSTYKLSMILLYIFHHF